MSVQNTSSSYLGTFGKTWSNVDLFMGRFFALIFIAGGLFALYHSFKLEKISATVTNANCVQNIINTQNNQNNKVMNMCNLKISYNVNNIDYYSSLQTNETMQYNVGDNINILYNPQKPDTPEEYVNYTLYGIIAIIIAIIIYFVTNYWYNLAQGSEQGAQIVGAVDGFSLLRNIFN